MRIFLVAVVASLIVPAFAQNGLQYANTQLGYAMDIPDGFVRIGESESGNGQVFAVEGRPIELVVWGDALPDNFEHEVIRRLQADTENGWTLTDQVNTPRWASYSATRNGEMLHQRMILLCDGAAYAAFRVHYPLSQLSTMGPQVEGLVASLRSTSC